jgi:predicted outer membrane repeat protein
MIDQCTFSGNSSPYGHGGALYCGDAQISDSVFAGNSAVYGGGLSSRHVVVTNTTLSANTAQLFGGAIDGGGTVNGCTISSNNAGSSGGGIAAESQLGVTNCTIIGNSTLASFGAGGGIASLAGVTASIFPMVVSNSTVASNTADIGGGLDLNALSPLQMHDTVVANNMGSFGPDMDGTIQSMGYNLIGNPAEATGFVGTDLLNVDPLLGPLQDNGGPTFTEALLPHSPAIGAGDPTNAPATDQRGLPRMVNGKIDIGAYQTQSTAVTQLVLSVPSNVTAGVPFSVTVTAMDSNGNTISAYAGSVTFSSTDPYPGSLPASYTFTPADQGTHSFSVSLFTAGPKALTVQDTGNNSLTANTTITVTAATASHFLITAPATAISGMRFDLTITALDTFGNVDVNYAGTVVFTSSDTDPGVMLPANYTFQGTDNGAHTFASEATLITPGDQTVTVTDTASGINGSAMISVDPGMRRARPPDWFLAWLLLTEPAGGRRP